MRIGAHTSIAGSLDLAVARARKIGCECLQIFYGSPRQWRQIAYAPEAVERFRTARARAALDPLVAHAAYLVNLSSPSRATQRRSVESLVYTAGGMRELGGAAVITHIGGRHGGSFRAALRRIARNLVAVLQRTADVMVLLEGSAGGTIGTFEELQAILAALDWHPRLGVCLDTCHLYATGWDLRTPAGADAMARAFDRTVGLERLRAIHLNDSKGALGSHRDRHENIGKGEIGRAGFRAVLAHPALRDLPGIIETPGFEDEGPDRKNIQILKRLRREASRGASRE